MFNIHGRTCHRCLLSNDKLFRVRIATCIGRVCYNDAVLPPPTDTGVLFCSQCYSCSGYSASNRRTPPSYSTSRGVSTQRTGLPRHGRVPVGRHGTPVDPRQPVRVVCVRCKFTIRLAPSPNPLIAHKGVLRINRVLYVTPSNCLQR